MKNYYEILEVSRNASPEVIEKAYKTLIKKYHPDLQPPEKKEVAENKVKLINEAYSVLSDNIKKSNYDNELKSFEYKQNIERQNIEKQNIEKRNLERQNVPRRETNSQQVNNRNSNQNLSKQEVDRINAINKAYNDAYTQVLRNMGYKIKYKRTFKEWVRYILSIILAIVVLVVLFFILWQIPFIKNFFLDLYANNEIFKIFVDIIHNIFVSFIGLFKK